MQFWIWKTGMEMFDVCRAYGIGYVVRVVSDNNPTLSNIGPYYEIFLNGDFKVRNPTKNELNKILSGKSWDRLYWHMGDEKIKKNKGVTRKILLKEIKMILNTYLNKDYIPQFSGNSTLQQTLDVAASKGIRRSKSNVPRSESPLRINQRDLSLAEIGFNFTFRKLGRKFGRNYSFEMDLIPIPIKIDIDTHEDITDNLRKSSKGLFNISELTVLSHFSIKLAKEIRSRIKEKGILGQYYNSIYFQLQIPTGNRSKPGGGGFFPLKHIIDIVLKDNSGDLEVSDGILNKWDSMFRKSWIPGNEQLGMKLGEYIYNPNIITLDRLLKTNLRTRMDKKIYIEDYNKDEIKEVIRLVN